MLGRGLAFLCTGGMSEIAIAASRHHRGRRYRRRPWWYHRRAAQAVVMRSDVHVTVRTPAAVEAKRQPVPSAPPPGWYPDPAGIMRWWDGQAWTSYIGPPQQPQQVAVSP